MAVPIAVEGLPGMVDDLSGTAEVDNLDEDRVEDMAVIGLLISGSVLGLVGLVAGVLRMSPFLVPIDVDGRPGTSEREGLEPIAEDGLEPIAEVGLELLGLACSFAAESGVKSISTSIEGAFFLWSIDRLE